MHTANSIWIPICFVAVIILLIVFITDLKFDISSKRFSCQVTKKFCGGQRTGNVLEVNYENNENYVSISTSKCNQIIIGDSIQLIYDYDKKKFLIPYKKSRASGTFLSLASLLLFAVLYTRLKK